MDIADEKELIRKLVFTGHLSVPERRALPGRVAQSKLIYSVVEEVLASRQTFHAWWLPDDSMIGCKNEYRGDGPGRLCRRYSGIEGERESLHEFRTTREAAEEIVGQIRQLFGGSIDGVVIDWAD